MVLMSATIQGTDSADWISADEQDNLILALGGDDEIYAPLGDNQIDGGTGQDTLVIYEGVQADFDLVRTADGQTYVEGPALNGGVNVNVLTNVERILFLDGAINVADIPIGGEPPIDPPTANIVGTDAGEWLSGSDSDDIIDARGGNDEIYAPSGDNFIFGGAGSDALIVYEGVAADFNVVRFSDGVVTVTGPGINGQPNTNVLYDVERILFNDGSVFVDSLPVTPGNGPTPPGGPTDPTYGVIGLETSVISVNEAAGSIEIAILRTNGSDGAITVDYQTVAATATDGQDYQGVSGTATFADGQTRAIVSVQVQDDSDFEGDETFTFTIDNVTGGATLLSPRTATITIVDDESPATALFSYDNFNNTNNLNLNGDATRSGNRLQLTDTVDYETGSVFLLQPLAIDADTSFSTNFTFQIGGGADGADGLAFVLQNSGNGSNALGLGGGAVGYAGIPQSLAIEFDTYDNGPADPSDNHIDILRDGDVDNELASGTPAFNLNDGTALTAWIDYDGDTNVLEVYLSDTDLKPATATVSSTVDIADVLGNRAFMGFTAATGGLNNAHELLDWEVSSNSQLLPAPPTSGSLTTETVVSGFVKPTAVDWSPDGENMYISEQGGVVQVLRNGQLSTFIDFSDEVNGTRDRGLLDIAVHPDFENNPYVYLLYTYDPPDVYENTGDNLAGPDKNGNRAGRLTRVTADAATNYTTFVEGSEVTLLGENSTWDNFNAFANSTNDFTEPPAGINSDGTNVQDFIASDSESHTVGSVEFGTDGALYVTIGDGASYNRVDDRAVRVQDIDNLSGKVLRVDPLTGDGLSDNPFFNGDADANRSKVYQLGVRNSFRMAIDPVTGLVYTGDVGWGTWEEINVGGPGSNFGWPYFEGSDTGSQQQAAYSQLTEAQQFYNSGAEVTAPLVALNHGTTGINAIVMGDIYRGSAYPTEYYGDIFFNDLGQGVVRNVSLDAAGNVTAVDTFDTGANVVVMIQQGPDGLLYYVDLDDGEVGRWVIE